VHVLQNTKLAVQRNGSLQNFYHGKIRLEVEFERARDDQGTKWHRNIAENFNRLSSAHERY